MERFLSQCANYIYRKHQHELEHICLVFPNRRSGAFFTSYLKDEIETPVIGPKSTTINELIGSYSDMQKAEKLQLIALLYDMFKRHTKTTETFDEFYFWGEILLADFNDIDRYLVRAEDLFTNISDLKEIDSVFDYLSDEQKEALQQFWGSMAVVDKKGFQEKYISIWSKLYPVYRDFKAELLKDNLAFPGMADRAVVEKLDSGAVELPFTKYYIIGLNALNACERRFFEHLQKLGKVEFLWDYDKNYLEDRKNEAGYFMRDNLLHFPPPADFDLNTEMLGQRKAMKMIAVPSVYGQAQAIPDFLNETRSDYHEKFDNTAIVLADESLLFSAMGAIPNSVDKVNVTMGYPVRNSVVYGFLLLLTALLKNKKKEGRDVVAYHRYVTDVLNHQLLGDVETEKSRNFVTTLKQQNRITVSLKELNFSPLHKLIFSVPDQVHQYSDYFLNVLGGLYAHLNKAEQPDSMLLELIYAVYQSVERLGSVVKGVMETRKIQISETVYFRLFSQYLGQVSVAFEGEPLSGMQVMGILETRCLDFKNLIILGLNENKWPRKFTAPSFIPHNIRLGFGLPGIDEQDAMYGYYFYRLVQRAKNITATYSVVREGISTGELSRYGYQLQYDSTHKPEMMNLDFQFSNDPIAPIRISGSKEISQFLLAKNSEDYPLSPSAINTYLQCSLKFYFKYVVKLPEPDEVKEEIDGVVFGNIFHDTMEELYKPFVGKVVEKGNIEAIQKNKVALENEIVKQIAIHYLKQSPKRGAVNLQGKTLLIFENIKTYLHQLLRVDATLAPFSIVSLEEKYKRKVNIGDRQIWIGGNIDRVDRVEGITRVLDYKTGNVKSLNFKTTDELFERDVRDPKKEILQALIYSWGLSKNGDTQIQSAIYGLRSLFSDNFAPEVKMNYKPLTFGEISNEFETELKGLVSEIYSPENTFKQTEFADKCGYCPYKGICRRF